MQVVLFHNFIANIVLYDVQYNYLHSDETDIWWQIQELRLSTCKTDGVRRSKRVMYIFFTFYFAGQIKREKKSSRWIEERREYEG